MWWYEGKRKEVDIKHDKNTPTIATITAATTIATTRITTTTTSGTTSTTTACVVNLT